MFCRGAPIPRSQFGAHHQPHDTHQWALVCGPGRKCRYAYIAEAVGVERGHTGLVKVDLSAQTPAAAVVGRLAHGPGWMGGEATYVPRSQDPAALKGALPVQWQAVCGMPPFRAELSLHVLATWQKRAGIPAKLTR